MKTTGIVRRFDNLGRVVIPKEIMRNFNIKAGDPIEIFVEGEHIILKKFESKETYASSIRTIIDNITDEKNLANHVEISEKLKEAVKLLENN